MWLLALTLVGCGYELAVDSSQAGCTDFDFDEEAVTTVEAAQSGLSVNVRRTNVVKSCDALFDPVVSSDGGVVNIREYWLDEGEGDCETCWVPTVTVVDPPSRKVEYRWYLGDEDVPVDTVVFKAD